MTPPGDDRARRPSNDAPPGLALQETGATHPASSYGRGSAALPSVRGRPRKHSFSIAGHRTSISLEHEFWEALREIAKADGLSLAALVAEIDRSRGESGLSGAIRVHVLDFYRSRSRAPSGNEG